jgi:hypothetical protein
MGYWPCFASMQVKTNTERIRYAIENNLVD